MSITDFDPTCIKDLLVETKENPNLTWNAHSWPAESVFTVSSEMIALTPSTLRFSANEFLSY